MKPVRVAWLLFALFLLGILFVGYAHSAEVFRSQRSDGSPVALRLSEKPCEDARVIAHLREALLDDRRFKAATLTYGGRDWASCWAEIRGAVVSIDEAGSPLQPVPRARFRDEAI